MTIGVLGFQKGFEQHIKLLEGEGITCKKILTLEDLSTVEGLIIPHGNVVELAASLQSTGLDKEIVRRVALKKSPLVVLALGSGTVLAAKKIVGHSALSPLGLIDIVVENAERSVKDEIADTSLSVDGIMAPLPVRVHTSLAITNLGTDIEVMAEYQQKTVCVRSDTVFASTFDSFERSNLHMLFAMTVEMNNGLGDYL